MLEPLPEFLAYQLPHRIRFLRLIAISPETWTFFKLQSQKYELIKLYNSLTNAEHCTTKSVPAAVVEFFASAFAVPCRGDKMSKYVPFVVRNRKKG